MSSHSPTEVVEQLTRPTLAFTDEVQPYCYSNNTIESTRLMPGLSQYATTWIKTYHWTRLPNKYRLALYVRAQHTQLRLLSDSLAAVTSGVKHEDAMRLVLQQYNEWKDNITTGRVSVEQVKAAADEWYTYADWAQAPVCENAPLSMVQVFLALSDGHLMSFPVFVESTQLSSERVFKPWRNSGVE